MTYMNISPEADRVWSLYCTIFRSLWGIPEDKALALGIGGAYGCSAEFREYGPAMYTQSVLLPIRNAWYSSQVLPRRFEKLASLGVDLKSPILDWGCGVGAMGVWIKLFVDPSAEIYCHDLPEGPQAKVLAEVCEEVGMKRGIPDKPATVLCLNVLEHMEHPLLVLEEIIALGGQLVANCDLSFDEQHIAPMDERREAIKRIKEHGIYFD